MPLPIFLRWPLRPRWLCLTATAQHCEAPPSRFHGLYGFSPSRGCTLYAIVPLNLILFLLREIWFAAVNPMRWIKTNVRMDDDRRIRGIEMEWRRMQRECHHHKLIWTGDRFITYDQAEAMAKDPKNSDPIRRTYL